MKKLILNVLSIFAGILLAIIIINSQSNQRIGHSKPMTREEHHEVYQSYLDYEEGRK